MKEKTKIILATIYYSIIGLVFLFSIFGSITGIIVFLEGEFTTNTHWYKLILFIAISVILFLLLRIGNKRINLISRYFAFIELLISHWRITTQTIISIIAVLWIYDEITSTASYWGGHEPRLTVIVGILVCWGIIMFLLKGLKQNERKNLKI